MPGSSRDASVHDLFEEQVRRKPDETAVEYEGQSLTYAELNRRADRLARYLRRRGVGADDLVGICMERGVEMVVGLVGVLKAGGAYLPLDPSYPTERLRYMIEDACPKVIVTHADPGSVLPPTQVPVVVLNDESMQIEGCATEALDSQSEVGESSLVYVIYTSGSTGCPKGTAMPHRAMVNLIEWHRGVFAAGKRVLQFAALSFDVAFQEIFSTLCLGGTLVLLNEWIRRDAYALAEFLCGQRIERLFIPPLMLQSLVESCQVTRTVPESLRDVICAGEQLRISPEIAGFFAQLQPCRLHNHYGPTETHVVTALTLAGDVGGWPMLPAIGRPISNTQIYVLDEQRQPVLTGVVGEIYIGGVGVARGYLNRSELSAERFLPNPYSIDPQARLYKTGDLGRWRADGVLEYLGRNDEQVKIRGYRIELGEIEAGLAQHEKVKEVTVLVREDVVEEKRLIAYFTPRGPHAPGAEELRAHLKAMLPDYMVPSVFVTLASFPLTPNGKLDRRALPEPDSGAYVGRPYEAPRGEVEEAVAAIWRELLRVEHVGRQHNFFELGGHSLLIVQMMERLRRVGLSTDVRSVYVSPTLADLAGALKRAEVQRHEVPPNLIPPGCEHITPQMLSLVELDARQIETIVAAVPGGAGNIQDIYPLAPLQEGMLFHHLMDRDGGDTYVLLTLLMLPSRTDLEKLIRALQRVIDRHDALRTAILWQQLPYPVQVVYCHATLPMEEVFLNPDLSPAERINEWLQPQRQRLDLQAAPLLRLQFAPVSGDVKYYALLQLHHMACDNDSLENMLAEVVKDIDGCLEELPTPVAYRNHVARTSAGVGLQSSEAFFQGRLREVVGPSAPFGLVDVHADRGRLEQAREVLESPLAQGVRAQARRFNVSAAALFHAAWALVVSRTSDRDDVVYGTVLSGRAPGNTGSRAALGMFINTLPLRVRLTGVAAGKLVEQTQRELAELLQHDQASLAVAQRCSGIGGGAPLFSTLLNYYHSAVENRATFPTAGGIELLNSRGGTNYPITLSVDDQADGFVLTVETDRRIEPSRILGYIRSAMRGLVDVLERAPGTPALELSILPAAELSEVVEKFNATRVAYRDKSLIHQLFEEQAKSEPNHIALECDGLSLTYAELNRRANQLAHFLRRHQVGPDDRVGLCVSRSVETLVGLLGVLKAGAAYVPMDAGSPTEWLKYLIDDSAPKVVLTQLRVKARLSSTTAKIVSLDGDWPEMAKEDASDPALPRLTSENLAYVMYTSGSTGQPKGVMVSHRNIVNYSTHAMIQFDVASGEGSLIGTSMNFDLALTGLYPALICGRTVRLCSETDDLSQAVLGARHRSPVKLTPSHLAMLSLPEADISGRVRALVLGGEPLLGSALRWWRRHSGETRIFNHYGPTEATVGCAVYEIPANAEGPVPIGRPISNSQIYILDSALHPVPVGVTGELYIGGAGVARGYWNRPELTAQRFVPDPFGRLPCARLYRTGDLGRWRSDGAIEYLGRNDQQIKIRGFRIEPGDIEAQVIRLTGARDVVILAREDVAGDKRLVAYVGGVGLDDRALTDLGSKLTATLPKYMIPSAFVLLPRLPLTANGKVDKQALPPPGPLAYGIREYAPPQGYLEEALAEIWQELLQIERVGRHDNFFELGGHSLLATRVIARVSQRLDVDLPLRMMFETPTVEALGRALSEEVEAETYKEAS